MKAIIENAPVFLQDDSKNGIMLEQFNILLRIITASENETDLRHDVLSLFSRYFKWGFGSSHMWVHQKSVERDLTKIDENKRILIVEFDETI